VSGYAFDRADKLGNSLQPYAFLPKPYTAAELTHHVSELLKNHARPV